MGKTASLSRPYLHEGMVLQFLQYGGMDRESEAVFRMRIDARNGANADDLCRWLQGYSPAIKTLMPSAESRKSFSQILRKRRKILHYLMKYEIIMV